MKHNKLKNSQVLTSTTSEHSAQQQTCILPVDAFHHQFQVFLIVLQVMDKLFKGELAV